MKKIESKRRSNLVSVFIIISGFIVILTVALLSQIEDRQSVIMAVPTSESPEISVVEENVVAQSNVPSDIPSTDELLLYLIEEEKLAHDIYAAMSDLYGAKVFSNIMKSETSHQNKVSTLLLSRNVTDPRSTEPGIFVNQELQKLYDALLEQGSQNIQEAYNVGIAIEQKDIADISRQIETTADENILSVLRLLKSGSENHLAAFERQKS